MIIVLSIIATILSFGGNLLINLKKRYGFIIWILSNMFWVWVAFISPLINWSQIVMFLGYIGMNIWGFIKWKKGVINVENNSKTYSK